MLESVVAVKLTEEVNEEAPFTVRVSSRTALFAVTPCPTTTFFTTAIPPCIIAAPVVREVASIVDEDVIEPAVSMPPFVESGCSKLTEPETFKFPPMNKLFAIPAPPDKVTLPLL